MRDVDAVVYCSVEEVEVAVEDVGQGCVGLCADSSCPILLGWGFDIESEDCRRVREIRWRTDGQIHNEEAAGIWHQGIMVAISSKGFVVALEAPSRRFLGIR